MALRKLAKDEDSGKHGCPTVYADDDAPTQAGAALVLQGDVVDVGDEAAPRVHTAARCVWTADDKVLVLGDRLDESREHELENVLPGEAAVSMLAQVLFDDSRVGRVDDLGDPGRGQVLLTIKARTVRAARARHHEETS